MHRVSRCGWRRSLCILLALGVLLAMVLGPAAVGSGLAQRPPGSTTPPSAPSMGRERTPAAPIDAGSFEIATVRILGVPVLRVASPSEASGSQALAAANRARVIEGNLKLLYQSQGLCGLGEQLTEMILQRLEVMETSTLCAAPPWGQGAPEDLSLKVAWQEGGEPVIEAWLAQQPTPLPLLTVTWADARLNGTTPAQLAEEWRRRLEQRLRLARATLQPRSLQRRIGLVAIALVLVAFLLVGCLWLWGLCGALRTRLQLVVRGDPSRRRLLAMQILGSLRLLLLMLMVFLVCVIISLGVLAVPGRLPLALALLLAPLKALVKLVTLGLVVTLLQGLAGFLLYQWQVRPGVPLTEKARRRQRFHGALRVTHRLIQLGFLIAVVIWILVDLPGVREISAEFLVAGGAILGGLAIVFQGMLRDFIAGMVILGEDHYAIGDWVEILGFQGDVEDIGVLSTSLRCLDQRLVVVRNSSFQLAVNHTKLRSGMEVTVTITPLAIPIDAVLASLEEVLHGFGEDPDWSRRLIEPPLLRGVREINALGVTLSILLITHTGHQWAAQREVLRRVLQRFQADGVPISCLPEWRGVGPAASHGGPGPLLPAPHPSTSRASND